jgi:hypothetical protein
LDDRVIAVQGERRGDVAAALACKISPRQRCRIYLGPAPSRGVAHSNVRLALT